MVEAADENEQYKINDAIALFNLAIIYYSMSLQMKGGQIRTALEDLELEKFDKFHQHFRELLESLDKIVALRPLAPLSMHTSEILVQGLANINIDLIIEIERILKTPADELEFTLERIGNRRKEITGNIKTIKQFSQEVSKILKASDASLMDFNETYNSSLEKITDETFTEEAFDEVLIYLIDENVIHGVFLKDNIKKIAITIYNIEIDGINHKSACEITNKSGGWYMPYFGCEDGKNVSDDGFGFFGRCKLCGKKRKNHVRIW